MSTFSFIYWNNKDWLNRMLTLLMNINSIQIKNIRKCINSENIDYINKHVHLIIKDFISYKLDNNKDCNIKQKTKNTKPDVMWKMNYVSKGVELLDLGSILSGNTIKACLPNNFKYNKPTILFKYKPPIRNKIFIT